MKSLSRPRRIAALYLEVLLILFVTFTPVDIMNLILSGVLFAFILASIFIATIVLLGKG